MKRRNKLSPGQINYHRRFITFNLIFGVNLIFFCKTTVKAGEINTPQDILNQNSSILSRNVQIQSINPLAIEATSGEWGTCQWDINADGQLTIHAGKLSDLQPNWINSASLIKSVYVEPGVVAGSDAQKLFYGLSNATKIDVTNLDVSQTKGFSNMFGFASKIEGSSVQVTQLKQIIGLDKWNTSNALDMKNMFFNAYELENLDVSSFDTAKVYDMSGMFSVSDSKSATLTKITGLDHLNTENVTTMSAMFDNQSKLTELNVSNFDTSKVESYANMFNNDSSLSELDVSNFNTKNSSDMSNMFEKTKNLKKLDVSNFVTDNVEKMLSMFSYCSADIVGLQNFNTSNVTTFTSMFSYSNLINTKDLVDWDTSNATTFASMFSYCRDLVSVDVSKWDTHNLTDVGGMFYFDDSLTDLKGLENWSTSKITNMTNFLQRVRVTELEEIENWDTSQVTNMNGLFYGCTKLQKLDISKWDTSQVTNMGSMFGYLLSLTEDNFKGLQTLDTSKVTDMNSMFISDNFSVLDLSNFDTSKVETMVSMFNSNNKQKLKIIGNFDTSKVKTMSSMFGSSDEMDFSEFNIKDWNLSSLTDMRSMFAASQFTNVDFINNWDVSHVKYFNNMFQSANKLRTLDLSKWDTSSATDFTSFFYVNQDLWKISFGPKFVMKNPPSSMNLTIKPGTEILDDNNPGFKAISDKWQEVDSAGGGTDHKPVGKLFGINEILQAYSQAGQPVRTFVWQQQEYRELSLSVPDIDYGTISGSAGVYQRKSDGPVTITKYSYPTPNVSYKLMLSMESPLQTKDEVNQLPGELIYRDDNNNDISLSSNETLIHTGTIGNETQSLTWSKNKGILLKMTGDIPVNGKYHATLNWTMTNSL